MEGGEFAGQPEAAGPVLVTVALAEVVGTVVDFVVDAELADEIVVVTPVAVVAVPGIHCE